MQVAEAVANIVRARREYSAAVAERVKAERYEGEAWAFYQDALRAGREVFEAAGVNEDDAVKVLR